MDGQSLPEPLDETLRLTNCRNCGYRLTGLPEEGACPECGKRYGQSVIVLHGWGRGKQKNPHTAKRQPITLFEAFVILGITALVVRFPLSRNSTSMVVFLAIAFLSTGVAWWRRSDRPLATMVRVELSSSGIQQINLENRLSVIGWDIVKEMKLKPLKQPNHVHIRVVRHGRWYEEKVVVDAEVLCTPGGVRALSELVEQFRIDRGVPPLNLLQSLRPNPRMPDVVDRKSL